MKNEERSMIRVSVMYPNSEGATFDIEYYTKNHIPMVNELLGDAVKSGAVDAGLVWRSAW